MLTLNCGQTLDPSINTVPYILALLIRIRSLTVDNEAFKPGGPLWQKATTFLAEFDVVQIRYTGSLWRDLLHALEASARAHGAVSLSRVKILGTCAQRGICNNCFRTDRANRFFEYSYPKLSHSSEQP